MDQERKTRQSAPEQSTLSGPSQLLHKWPEFRRMSPERRKSFTEARARILPRLGDSAFVEAVGDQGLNGQ